ncbi:hypothetical protein EfmAA818_23370 [Enterococcus faecium]|nr:hypothetical protein EfmAA818_23370 [Enterococcus faecium]
MEISAVEAEGDVATGIKIVVRALEEPIRQIAEGVYIGIGIDSDGRRTILGFDVQDGESEDNWDTVFQSFVQRGLFGVKLVISDASVSALLLTTEAVVADKPEPAAPAF